ncbi:protein translocase SEC61 complex subunit gamma [Pyrococcus abyssi]|uniref:Protein translocase subunit SecE n=1 Tax=Pyrococcus abyssi (strain GE5 / Orsay) TaxID=272844 RepID=SECE_PYRAB|nr:protein translocase SEC61 complex subunit gamma [Pyrococcus abyssi]Q9V2S1.1 RecName: Full=Protein translocase subunit SecE; AltName: Full=Protein transport protein Sec61 gamma subunit homolog [Pyrococcus abyssi GE5]CAB48927.1 Preprotein translocase secE subunit (protein transport protein SEC61 gamma subunit homolog [Pyrococcus abyssi GE5]CCE69369.1 TPA: preprotein translocase subunit SecE [Pyrococcus abyssi GE5]
MPELQERIRNFLKESKRVFLVTRKPGWEEYKKAAKITGLGIILIGLIGMLIRIMGILVLGG